MGKGSALGALVALGLTANAAQASQVGIAVSGGGHTQQRFAQFTAAPWEANTVTMQWADAGATVIFRDTTGTIGANPPTGQGPCTRISTHEARCQSAAPFDGVQVSLGDAGSSYTDLPGSPPGLPLEFINGGVGNDRIVVGQPTYWTIIRDLGGTNSFQIAGSAIGEIEASDGWTNQLDVRNGHAGDSATCDVRAGYATDGSDRLLDGDLNGRVLSDPGDTVSGCGDAIPAG